jgi:hypothetical protein
VPAVLDPHVFVLGQIRKALVDPDDITCLPESTASLAKVLGCEPNLGVMNVPTARSPPRSIRRREVDCTAQCAAVAEAQQASPKSGLRTQLGLDERTDDEATAAKPAAVAR